MISFEDYLENCTMYGKDTNVVTWKDKVEFFRKSNKCKSFEEAESMIKESFKQHYLEIYGT